MKKPEQDHPDISSVVSATECTGLIQTPPVTEDEYESYQDLFGMEIPKKKPDKE